MTALRRRFDSIVQFASFTGIALLVVGVTRSLAAAAAAVPLLVLAARTLRAGVSFDTAGMTVRNTFRTHRIPWDDYERVDIGRAGRPALPVVVVRRRSAKPVALWCLQPSSRGKRGTEKLTAVLREVQQSVSAARPAAA